MQASDEAKYYKTLADSCRDFLDLFGQEELPPQENQDSGSKISEYRRQLEKKLEQFDSQLDGLIGDRSHDE